MKTVRLLISVFLVFSLLFSMLPVYALEGDPGTAETRSVHNTIIIDDDAAGGYEGDYVVIYNPATSSSTSYSTGTMTGLIETSVGNNAAPGTDYAAQLDPDAPFYKIDVDSQMALIAETAQLNPVPEDSIEASYNVGDTKTFSIYASYSPTGSGSVQFKCLYVGQHCYIWTPTSSANNTYPLDVIDTSFAQLAAEEFDSKFDLMQSSFGNHTNGSNGDGKLHMLYYNINDGWQPGQGYVAGFFYQVDISNNGLPILNIDTYPGVYYKNPDTGNERKTMEYTYNTMVHEYQHLINYSNTSGMSSWLNECFSAAAEEICYPGSSVISRIQSWENYYYSDNNDWLNPPEEFEYNPTECPNLHQGYSMYGWSNNISDVLALYGQVSLFAQYLFTRFGNTIYQQISNKYSSSETTAITNATGISCSDLVRDFRIALTANAAQNIGFDQYGFREQDNYDPAEYYNVMNPYSLLAPIVFTGTSCSIKGGGAITVKPVNGVYNPPSGASSSLRYFGVKLSAPYTVTAVSNNENWGTVSVSGSTITAVPAEGYYVESCTLVSGEATWTISGNTISVSPASDCTIQVNFAQKPLYTVSFVASGAAEGTQTAYVNDAITLPSSVSVNVSGWTFSGWVTAQLEETTTAPEIFEPGSAYTVTSDATLYAVFTRVEEGTGEVSYELLSEAPADWAGRYVITYLTTTSMYIMRGVVPSSNGAQIENTSNAASYNASGVSLSGTTLTNVADQYLFTLTPHGSYYSIQSVTTGTYLGMDAESYMAGYNEYTASYCDWTPGSKDNCSTATNAAGGSYPLISFNPNNRYFWSGNPNNNYAPSVRWWKEVNGSTTFYTTEPDEGQDYVVSFSVPLGVTCPADMISNTHTGITLPTVEAPEGYAFLGWVTEDYSYVSDKPETVLTGQYTASGDVTLKALFAFILEDEGGDVIYRKLTQAPDDWEGTYVISYEDGNELYFLMGINSNYYYSDAGTNACKKLSESSVIRDGDMLRSVNKGLTFRAEADENGYRLVNANTGTYLSRQGVRLYSSVSYLEGRSRWNLAYDTALHAVAAGISENGSSDVLYLSRSTLGQFFGINNETEYAECPPQFWKAELTGKMTYTTVITEFEHRDIDVYVVDETNGASLNAWVWGGMGNLDASWPGRELNPLGTDKSEHPFYRLTLDAAYYNRVIFSRSGNPQTAELDFVTDAGENDYVVYYLYGVSGNDLQCSQGVDLWPNDTEHTEIVDPTCTEGGHTNFIGLLTGEVRVGAETDPLGHDWSDWTVTTEPTCSAVGEETRECARCHKTETREAAKTEHTPGDTVTEIVTAPSCTESGSHDEVVYCSICGEELSRTNISDDALGHDWGEWHPDYPATCTESGVEYRVCNRCSAFEQRDVDALGHDFGEWTVTTPATCEGEGEETRTCSRCGETETRTLEPIGHAYGAPTYEWNETADGWACTAAAVCANDASHILTETVDGTYSVVTEATTAVPGLGRYTAEFENELFETQTKDVEIPQLDPVCVEVIVVDETDSETLYAYYWGLNGSNGWPGTALTKTGDDMNGHPYYVFEVDVVGYGDGIIFGRGDGQPQTGNQTLPAEGYKVFYIYGQSGSELQVSADGTDVWPADTAVVTAPTCEECGYTTYTGLKTGETRTKDGEPALGHAWGEPSYAWSADNSSVTATAVCANDGTHVLTETVQTSYAVITPATETEPGTGVYTAEFTDEHFTTQTKEVEIPATNLDPRLNLMANLRADEEIVLAFSCSPGALSRYSSYYVELNVTNYLGETRTLRFGPEEENELVQESYNGMPRYFLYYYGIAAKQMGDRYTVQIHAFDAEGTEFFSPLVEGSIRDFLMGHLMNASNSGNFRRLAADMLDYGAEAQKFFHYDEEHLVNAPEDADEQAALEAFRTPDAPETTNTITQEGGSAYRFTFSLDLENKVVLFVQSTADPSSTGLQIVVKKAGTGEEVARLDAVQNPNLPNKFYANFEKVGASNMRTLYDIVMVDANGNKISKTLSWSVDAYLAQLRTEDNETLIPIVSAILVYGDSAGRYLGDPQGSFTD